MGLVVPHSSELQADSVGSGVAWSAWSSLVELPCFAIKSARLALAVARLKSRLVPEDRAETYTL